MLDRRPTIERTVVETGPDAADIQAAYERGRKDERAGRRRHPLMMTLILAAAAVGLVVLGIAAREGSFARGGGVVDQNLSVAADRAEPVVRDAAADAGQALKDAGQTVKNKTAEATK